MRLERRNGYRVLVGGPVPPQAAAITFGRLMQLSKGDVLDLDRTPDAPVDIRVNGTLVAKGDVVIVDGHGQ